MKKQSIYFLVIIILLVQTSCQQNNEEEDFFNNQITLLENNPRLYLSKIDSTQVTNLNNSKEATHFLLVSLANHYINNYYPHKGLLQKSIHIFTKKKLIQQQLESLLFLAKTYKKEKNLKMEVQAIEKSHAHSETSAPFWLLQEFQIFLLLLLFGNRLLDVRRFLHLLNF